MTRCAAHLALGGLLIGLLMIVNSQADPNQPIDLYKFDGEDDDSIFDISDLDMYGMRPVARTGTVSSDSSPHVNDEEQPAISSVSSADPADLAAKAPEPAAGGDNDDDDEGEWHEPENKMDLVRLFNGLYYQKQYAKINEYLVGKVATANVEDNLVEVGAWLAREQRAGKNMFLNQATTEALEQFNNLTRISEESVRCSRHAYAILWKNDRATGGKAHKPPSQLTPPRRVDAIVHQVCLKHAVQCYHVYPQKYAQIRAGMEPKARELVETVLDNVLGNVDCVTSKVRSLGDNTKEVAKHVLDSIESHSQEDPDRVYLGKVLDELKGRMAVRADKVGMLVERYLVEPCKYFVRKLGPDVFIPARFDALSLEHDDRYRAESRELIQFLHGWIHYRLCDALVKHDVKKLTKEVVRLVEKQSA